MSQGQGAGRQRRRVMTVARDCGSEAGGFEFIDADALGAPIVKVAQELLAMGLTGAEVCSLFTQTAAVLSRQDDGLPKAEWLALCAELHEKDELDDSAKTTAPGGVA